MLAHAAFGQERGCCIFSVLDNYLQPCLGHRAFSGRERLQHQSIRCTCTHGAEGEGKAILPTAKHAVATLAAAGKVFHPPAAVIKGMELLGKQFIASVKAGNGWTEPLAFRYLHQLRETFLLEKAEVPIYSLSWDATRLSSLDILAPSIYNPGLGLAGWCPPQASETQ